MLEFLTVIVIIVGFIGSLGLFYLLCRTIWRIIVWLINQL